MVSSSSTKRAARLAQKGKGKRVRFQGGTLFPMIVLAILVIGLGTIVYARASVPAADVVAADHRGPLAHGLRLLAVRPAGHVRPAQRQPRGAGDPHFADYHRTGVHSHDDGVIHWHPFTSAAVGKRATLGVFLENYGVELTDDSLKFPEDQNGGKEYIEGETKCPDGKDGELSVTVWQSPEDTSGGDRYVSGFDDIRMTKNSLVITIAFQPRGTDDPDADRRSSKLEELGAVDCGQVAPGATTTTVAGATTVPGSTPTTVAGATTVPGSTPTTVAGATPTTTPGATETTTAPAATATTATATTTG